MEADNKKNAVSKRTRPPRRQSRLPTVAVDKSVMNSYHAPAPENDQQPLAPSTIEECSFSQCHPNLMDLDQKEDELWAEGAEAQLEGMLDRNNPFEGEMVDSVHLFRPIGYDGRWDDYADTWELKALQYVKNRNSSPPKFIKPQKKNSNSPLAQRMLLNALNPPYLRAPREKCLATTMLYRAQRDTHRVANLFPYRYIVGGSSDFIDLDWHPDNNRFALSAICSDDDYNRPGNLCLGNIWEDRCTSISTHARWKESGKPFADNGDRPDPSLHTFFTISDVKFVNEGRQYVTSGYDGNIKVWDTDTFQCIKTLSPFKGKGKVERLATMNADMSFAAVMGIPDDHTKQGPVSLIYINKHTGESMIFAECTPTEKKNLKPDSITFAGTDLVVGYRGSLPNTNKWGHITMFDIRTRQQKMAWKGSAMAHQDLSYHRGGWVVAASGLRRGERESPYCRQMVRVLDTRQETAVWETYLPQYDINRVTISPCATFISASCTDASTTVWDWRISGKVFASLKHEPNQLFADLPDAEREDKDTGVTVALWQNDDILITGASDGAINRWNMRKPDEPPEVLAEMPNCVMSAKFSPNWEHLLVGDAGGHALLLNPRGVDGKDDEEADLPDHPIFGARNALRNIRQFKTTHSSGK